jgi:thiol-disulfide isomerase/thioredoxin
MITICCFRIAKSQPNSVSIKIVAPDSKGDTLIVSVIRPYVYRMPEASMSKIDYTLQFADSGTITVPNTSKLYYFKFYLPKRLIQKNKILFMETRFLIRPNEQIKIKIGTEDLDFSGSSSEIMKCQWEIAKVPSFAWKNKEDGYYKGVNQRSDTNYLNYCKNQYDSLFRLKAKILENYKHGLTDYEYSRIKLDIELQKRYLLYYQLLPTVRQLKDSAQLYSILRYYTRKIPGEIDLVKPDLLIESQYFDYYFVNKIYYELLYRNVLSSKIETPCFLDQVSFISERYEGLIKERALAGLCNSTSNFKGSEPEVAKLNSELRSFKSEDLKQRIIRFLNARTTNNKAFDFSLSNTSNATVKLSDFTGKVVMLDFWFTGCTWCAKYYQNILSKVEEHFAGDSLVKFISIGKDKNRKGWIASVNRGIYTTESAINLYLPESSEIQNRVYKEYNVIGWPSSVLIGKHQTIVTPDNAILRDVGKLIVAIENAKMQF